MADEVPFTVAVEGIVDEAVAARLLAGTGARAARVLPGRDRRQGKSWLDRNGPNLVAAGEHVPVLVLRDLDRDGCVVEVRNRIAARLSRFACVRIAVRAVEAWLLADREELAAQVGVRVTAVPAAPDELTDPKRALVDLARRSTRRATRDMLVPREGAGTSVGPEYALFIRSFVSESWSPDRAQERSPSLLRTRRAIAGVVADYRAFVEIR